MRTERGNRPSQLPLQRLVRTSRQPPLRKSHCDAAHPPNEVYTRSFDASNVKNHSSDRSPETPQPVLWTHEVRVPDCHNASCRVGFCGGLPSSIVVAWTPQLLARCADLINVEICFWLTQVLHRDQESTVPPPFVGLLQIVKAVVLRKREERRRNQTSMPTRIHPIRTPHSKFDVVKSKGFTSKQCARLKMPLMSRDLSAHRENI